MPRPAKQPSQIEAHRELRRHQRTERWSRARELIAQAMSRRAVCQQRRGRHARDTHIGDMKSPTQLRMGKATLRRVLQTDGCPQHAVTLRTLRNFVDELARQWQAGGHRLAPALPVGAATAGNGRELYRQIRAQGYRGSYQAALRFLQPLRQQKLETGAGICLENAATVPPAIPNLRTTIRCLPPRLMARCLAGNPPANSDEDQHHVEQLCLAVPELAVARELATAFRTLVNEHQVDQLAPWLEQAGASSLPEFQALAASLSRDQAAVELAISSQWSSGQVEGQVDR